MDKDKFFTSFIMLVLFPFSFVWEWVYRIRRFLYSHDFFRRNRYQVPIISVGNITFGGTGKTPLIMWITEYLEVIEKRVMVLLRGYKGALEHDSGILRAGGKFGNSPAEYGDESLLLVRKMKRGSVVVGKNRSANLEHYFDQERPDVVLLDDGHQHLKMDRRLNIVLFDALMPLLRYKVAPSGYMREGYTALKDADLVVISRSDQVSPQKVELLKKTIQPFLPPDVPFAQMGHRPIGLFDCNNRPTISLDQLKGKKVICVAGIASPLSFFALIESLGSEVIERISLPDHHNYRLLELEHLLEKAQKKGALIVTTEKDIVKIRRLINHQSVLYLEIKVAFLEGEAEFKEKINNVL